MAGFLRLTADYCNLEIKKLLFQRFDTSFFGKFDYFSKAGEANQATSFEVCDSARTPPHTPNISEEALNLVQSLVDSYHTPQLLKHCL